DYLLPELGVYALYSSRKYLPTSTRTLLDFLLDDLASDNADGTKRRAVSRSLTA
ncbi:LysR family transcriptional regulator, partial [Pectobacterium parmentieri]|nr:LysR family transcriptional regulator [Pectobacterium parmentieri]